MATNKVYHIIEKVISGEKDTYRKWRESQDTMEMYVK